MTEADWLAASDISKMLWSLQEEKRWDRKMRLLAVGYCRIDGRLMGNETNRNAVEVAEKFADGQTNREELEITWEAARDLSYDSAPGCLDADTARLAAAAATPVPMRSGTIYCLGWEAAASVARHVSKDDAVFIALLRDVVGPLPFRSFAQNLFTQPSAAASLAVEIYNERAFDRMPELADALEETECLNADILAHCRQSGPHARGCWVVDLILGRQ
jgi:hypothetical protein